MIKMLHRNEAKISVVSPKIKSRLRASMNEEYLWTLNRESENSLEIFFPIHFLSALHFRIEKLEAKLYECTKYLITIININFPPILFLSRILPFDT